MFSKFVTLQMSQWFPILHNKERKWLVKAAEQAKKSDEYKSKLDENININNSNNNSGIQDSKKYFDDKYLI